MPNIAYKEFLRKHTTEDIINKMDEDAPANAAGSGNIAGIGVGPDGEPGIDPKKVMKRKKEQGAEQEKITKKISKMVKESDDNNSTLLRGILQTINKLEDKIDEKNGFVKSDVTVETNDEKYVTFREKYYAKKS